MILYRRVLEGRRPASVAAKVKLVLHGQLATAAVAAIAATRVGTLWTPGRLFGVMSTGLKARDGAPVRPSLDHRPPGWRLVTAWTNLGACPHESVSQFVSPLSSLVIAPKPVLALLVDNDT